MLGIMRTTAGLLLSMLVGSSSAVAAQSRSDSGSEATVTMQDGNAALLRTSTELQRRYAIAVRDAILAKWIRPLSVPIGLTCRVIVRQLPGGEVLSLQITEPCPYDKQGRNSIEAAVLKAMPLPYKGFESLFQRELVLNFRAEDAQVGVPPVELVSDVPKINPR